MSLGGHSITKALDGRFIREAGWRSPPGGEVESTTPNATAKESCEEHYTQVHHLWNRVHHNFNLGLSLLIVREAESPSCMKVGERDRAIAGISSLRLSSLHLLNSGHSKMCHFLSKNIFCLPRPVSIVMLLLHHLVIVLGRLYSGSTTPGRPPSSA